MNIKRIGLIGGSGVVGGNNSIDVVNDLTTGGTNKALSAEQGKVLNSTKQNTLTGDEFKTVNGSSIWGSGNIVITGGEGASVEIVNDLTTGGTDKALSAEMGKEVGVKITELETKTEGVFDFVTKEPIKNFIKSIQVYGIEKTKPISFWDAKRNIDGAWQIRFAYTNPEDGNYAFAYNSTQEESDIHYEGVFYGKDSRLYSITVDMQVDWNAIAEGATLSGSRTSNVINTQNYLDILYIQNDNLDINNIYQTDILANKLLGGIKKIEIYGNFTAKLCPSSVTRNVNNNWAIIFVDENGKEYKIITTAEKCSFTGRLDKESVISVSIDWSIYNVGEHTFLHLSIAKVYVSLSRYNSISPYNSLIGKKILLFGDSITELKRENDNGEMKSYADIISDKTGCIVYNAAIGGTRLSRRKALSLTPTGIDEAYAALDVVELIKAYCTNNYEYQDAANDWLIANGYNGVTEQIDTLKNILQSTIDYIVVSAGTNDSQWVRVGEIEDDSPSTLYGSINLISYYITGTFKRIQLKALTPIVRYFDTAENPESWGDIYHSTEGNYKTLAEIVECISDAWKRNHIPCADMYWKLGINENNFSRYFPATDSVHPNYKGLQLMADAVERFMLSFGESMPMNLIEGNRVFDKIDTSNYKLNYYLPKFFRKVRITGASEEFRVTIWYIHRGTDDGTWEIKMLEYSEDPDASDGYVCAISSDSEKSILSGTFTNNRGAIEILVDWNALDDNLSLGATDRQSSRFSLECYI